MNSNNRRDNSLLAALIGSLAAGQRSAIDADGEGDPAEALMQLMDPAGYRLLNMDFEGLAPSAKASWQRTLQGLNDIDVDDIDSAFVVILQRQKAGEVCDGCGQVHKGQDKDGVVLSTGMVGHPLNVGAMVEIGLREARAHSVPSTQSETPEFVEGGDTPQ